MKHKRTPIPAVDTEAPSVCMAMKATPGEQDVFLAVGDPSFRPRYVGSKGWIGVYISDGTEWTEIAGLVEDSNCVIAPKQLALQVDTGH